MRQRAEAGQGAAPGREYTETKIIKRRRDYRSVGISRRLRDISQEYKRRRFDDEKDAPEGRGGYSSGRVRAMSAYQSNVKVEQLAEGGQLERRVRS